MTALKRVGVLAVCAVLAACASGRGTQQANEREPAVVVVDNRAVMDHNIYVLRGSQRVRLGFAGGLRKTRLTIPQGIVFGSTTLRFIADPIGSSRTPISEEINMSDGDEITLQIPPS